MLAILNIKLPFELTLQEGSVFNVYEYTLDNYKIRFQPPVRSEHVLKNDGDAPQVTLNGGRAFMADVLVVEFQKDEFNRQNDAPLDPPADLIREVVNHFLDRLRFVTNGTKITPVNFPQGVWRLEYRDDDKQELQKKEGSCRGRGSFAYEFSYTLLTPEIWEAVFSLPDNFEAPHWKNLLLDAHRTLPEIGPAIVLAYTALEVFISDILTKLALQSELSEEFWGWLIKRDSYTKIPSTAESFGPVLKELSGIDFKSEEALWKDFKNLQNARHTFVHKGVAINNETKAAIDLVMATQLVNKANEIIKYITSKLPEEFKLPEYKFKELELQLTKRIS